MSLQIVNRQINWGLNVCHLRKKLGRARDRILKDKFLPAELFIKNVCHLKFIDLISQYKESSRETKNFSFRIFEIYELTKTPELSSFFQRISADLIGVTGHWSEMFLGSGINCHLKSKKRNLKTKFKEKLNSEMVKLHDRAPIDRQVRGFRNFFYGSIKTKLFIYLRGGLENASMLLLCSFCTLFCGYNFKFTFLKIKKHYELRRYYRSKIYGCIIKVFSK